MGFTDEKLAGELLAQKLIEEKTLRTILLSAKSKGKSLEDALFERNAVSEDKLVKVIADLYRTTSVKLSEKTIPDTLLRIVPYTLASHQSVIPFENTRGELHVAFNNPGNQELISFLEKKIGINIKPYYASKNEIKAALKVYNRDVNEKFTKLLDSAMTNPTKIESLKDAAKILDTIILFAYQNNASDIHIEPHKDFILVRYRIDGLLQTITELPSPILDLLTTRIKVLSNLRTDEHRAAQDGRIKIELENNEITLRVSIIPTYDGEKTVLRILSSQSQELDLAALGYTQRNLNIMHNNMLKTHGMLLITGPTGSGKTTTLYSMLKELNSPEINISTIEDPIEYRLEGVNQIQANAKTNLTFATGLRSLLRQDPDVVMVGEIRDEETAGIAINAALTGHLVLATLHTNDAASTLPRLSDMGIEEFLISSTAKMVMGQRLVRSICSKCKVAYEVEVEKINEIGRKNGLLYPLGEVIAHLIPQNGTPEKKAPVITLYKGEGCSTCGGSGYKGRTTIAEVMEVSPKIQKMILDNESPTEIEKAAVQEGMTTMFIDGMIKVREGTTSIEEVLRVMRT